MKTLLHAARHCALACLLPATAIASTPAEQVRCTDEPRGKWLSEEKIKQVFGMEKYALVKFKVSRTNCYEFYAVQHSGEIIEAYYHPVTGKLVKENRVQPTGEVLQPPLTPRGRVR